MLAALLAAIFAAAPLVPASAPIAHAGDRVRDPLHARLPPDRAALIRQGYRLFEDTPRHAPGLVGNALSCGNCHLNAGQKDGALPLVGIATVFPEYNKRAGRPFSLEERIVGCFLRSLAAPGPAADQHENAHPHPSADAPEVRAIAAYLTWLSEGVTREQTAAWRHRKLAHKLPLAALQPARGRRLFLARCANCHGRNGQGVRIGELKPAPLWGPRPWNDGAGASRVYTLATYLRYAMPYTAPGTLTDEEAQQIAAFIDAQRRPRFARKDLDFLAEPIPKDAVYYVRSRVQAGRSH